MAIEPLDLAVIVLYLVVIVGLGCWVGLRRRKGEVDRSYFLAGGTLTWPVIGLALFSTNISTIHLVSQAQEGYMNGLAYGNFEWMAPFLLITLSLFFAPFYFRSKVATLPDFLEQRYSRGARDWLAVLSIVSAIVIHIGFTLYTGAVVLEGDVRHRSSGPASSAAAILTGLYTIVGGLLAVVLTESLQTIILLIGAISITPIGLYHAGGWSGDRGQRRAGEADHAAYRNGDPAEPALVLGAPGLPGHRPVVLVRGPDDRAARARGQGRESRAGRAAVRRLHQDPAGVHLRLPGTIMLALMHQGKCGPAHLRIAADQAAPRACPHERRSTRRSRLRGQEKDVRVDYVVQQTGLQEQEVSRTMTSLVERKVLKAKSDAVYAI